MSIQKETIKSERTGDAYYRIQHPSGLTILVYPKQGYQSAYAVFGTRYGSINTAFRLKDAAEVTRVPEGIAHFLEHKLFESEDGDAFARYAKTGASANAYTSFDATCYLFSCTQNFTQSLEILLDFVQSPYFTEKTVQKEQGIIGQEIRMYDDDPEWRVMFNLLGAMYHNHPVRIDIAGTVDSIAKITADTLYTCYNHFYNLHNMALCVAGNVEVDEVLRVADRILKPAKAQQVESLFPDEPQEVVKERVEQRFPIAVPMFQLGFKETVQNRADERALAQTEILLEALFSKASPLFGELMDGQLINTASFGYEYFEGPGYASVLVAGESRDPDKAANVIRKAVDRARQGGLDQQSFERARRAVYGRNLSVLNSPENIGNTMINFDFADRELFRYYDCLAETTLEDVNSRLATQLQTGRSALSVVLPNKE
jgi:predicted Zn-dependent peptidase